VQKDKVVEQLEADEQELRKKAEEIIKEGQELIKKANLLRSAREVYLGQPIAETGAVRKISKRSGTDSPTRGRVVAYVIERNAVLTISEVADALGIKSGQVGNVVKRAVYLGMLSQPARGQVAPPRWGQE